jgi:hypothetical protein
MKPDGKSIYLLSKPIVCDNGAAAGNRNGDTRWIAVF